jgi:hypothetical protein
MELLEHFFNKLHKLAEYQFSDFIKQISNEKGINVLIIMLFRCLKIGRFLDKTNPNLYRTMGGLASESPYFRTIHKYKQKKPNIAVGLTYYYSLFTKMNLNALKY